LKTGVSKQQPIGQICPTVRVNKVLLEPSYEHRFCIVHGNSTLQRHAAAWPTEPNYYLTFHIKKLLTLGLEKFSEVVRTISWAFLREKNVFLEYILYSLR
jgi:hypothetical protein